MALPEDEAKQTLDTEDESFENGALEQVEAPGAADPTGQDDSEQESTVSGDDALNAALAEAEKFKDLALRAEAEMQNLQRRTLRDVENAHKFGLEKFIQNLLPVVDSLEKAVEAAEQVAGDNAEAIGEGVRLCHKLMMGILSKEGVEVIDPAGEPFDRNEHQAMSMVENPDMEPNSVFVVVQKGCKLNGRLVRPAMVMVTKAPAEQEPESKE